MTEHVRPISAVGVYLLNGGPFPEDMLDVVFGPDDGGYYWRIDELAIHHIPDRGQSPFSLPVRHVPLREVSFVRLDHANVIDGEIALREIEA